MGFTNRVVASVLLPAMLVTTPALAQRASLVDAEMMRMALAAKADSDTAQRALVRRVLGRADVRDMAGRLGLSLERADSAVATVSGTQLSALAQHAEAVEAEALAGGANTIVISATTLLLILIIVILLAR